MFYKDEISFPICRSLAVKGKSVAVSGGVTEAAEVLSSTVKVALCRVVTV